MKKNDDLLLRGVLETEDLAQLRHRSLDQMLVCARARRRRRQIVWAGMCTLLPGLCAAAFLLGRSPDLSNSPEVSRASAARAVIPEQTKVPELEFISTEELLALFPGRPLALVGSAGEQRLIFLDAPLESP